MSRDLAQIKTDLNVKLDLEHAKAQELDVSVHRSFFKELEFRSLIKTLDRLSGKGSPFPCRCGHQKPESRCPCLRMNPRRLYTPTPEPV